MPKITAKAGFAHGPLDLKKGDTATVSAATAKELQKAGLIESTGPEDDEDDEEEAPAADRKMAEPVANKRAPDPASNKAATVTSATVAGRK